MSKVNYLPWEQHSTNFCSARTLTGIDAERHLTTQPFLGSFSSGEKNLWLEPTEHGNKTWRE